MQTRGNGIYYLKQDIYVGVCVLNAFCLVYFRGNEKVEKIKGGNLELLFYILPTFQICL